MKTTPFHRFLIIAACLCGAVSMRAQAPLDVTGVTDKAYNTYSGQASFRVPSSNGYSYRVLLDGQLVPTDVTVPVTNMDYHEVSVWRTNLQSGAVTNRLVRFIISTPGRGTTEHGIPPQTPLPAIPSAAAEFSAAHLRILAPPDFPVGYESPVVAWVVNDGEHAIRANGSLTAEGHPSITIKRGVGSGFLAATNPAGLLNYTPQIKGLQTNKTITLAASTTWTTASGVLSGTTVWSADARINVTGHLTVPAGASLTIGAGAIVRLNPGLNITNNGAITINGTVDRPVVFMPNSRSQPWGGFFMRTATGSIDGSGVIFMASGADPNGGAGHRSEQCLFLCSNTPSVKLTDSAAIYMAGQLGHAYNGGTFTYTRFLMQRATTGGEYTGATFRVNDSAFMECPDDSVNFVDGDNDGLYLVSGTHGFTNTLFGWVKDDGIDSGGDGLGRLHYENCWFEATFHEGNSLSGLKNTTSFGTVYLDCGQGLEDGYGAGSGGPTGRVDNCLFSVCKIGVRHGDNYDSIGNGYPGNIGATNSVFLHNHHDVWGYNWRSAGWTNAVGQMFIGSNFFTVADASFPANAVWNSTNDFWRLTNWMTTPHDAAVGVGLAVRTNRFALNNLFDGLLGRLSSFSTNVVVVNYSFLDTNGATLATDVLAFEPGQTLRRIYPSGFNVSAQNFVRVLLTGAVNGELTGQTSADFIGSAPAVTAACWIGTNLLAAGRLPEGVLVQLNTAAGLPVTVDYAYTAAVGALAGGTLTFTPGETVKWISPAGVGPYDQEWTRLTLSNPSGATLAGISSVLYTNPPLTVSFGVATNQLSLGAFSNGLPVVLNAPAPAGGVTVDFQYEGNGGVLTNGTLAFAAGQTSRQLTAPTVNSESFELIRARLSNPTSATLGSPATVYYLRIVTPFIPTNATFIARGSVWRFFDKTNDLGTAWRSNTFSDLTWSNGCTELGFGDNDECSKIVSNAVNTCYYFRSTFNVDNPLNFTNVSLWLLRDDAGVVYLNGGEVFRSPNLPAAPNVITNRTLATSSSENAVDTATLSRTNLVAGPNLIAVEIHQQSRTSSDLSFNLELLGNAAPPPPLPPSPVIASPTNGELFPSGANLFVNVSAGAVTNLVLYVDTVSVAAVAQSPPTIIVVSNLALASGPHDLIVLGTDSYGQVLASAPVRIEVFSWDSDGDGMLDQWERDHGLVVGVNDANLDADGDGFSNLAEYIAGTDPRDPNSYLKVSAVGAVGGHGFVLQFTAVAGKTYTVQYADVLPTNFWARLQNITAAPTNRPVQVTNLNAASEHRYYRLITPAQ